MAAGTKSIKAGEAFLELKIKDAGFSAAIDRATTKLKTLGSSLRIAGVALLGFGTASGAAFLASAKMAAGYEVAEAAFTALTGSAQDARDILRDLLKFSGQSSFGFDTLQGAARNMLNFGVSAKQVMPLMRQLAAIAAGDADRLDRLAIAFGQTQAKGRLMAEEVRQMVNAGFNPLQEIARTTGRSMNDLIVAMEAGQISAEQVANSFATVTGPGGRFAGILERISKTATGQFRQALAAFQLAAIEVGNHLLPALTDILKRINELLPKVQAFISRNKELVIILATLSLVATVIGAGLIALGAALSGLGAVITVIVGAAKLLLVVLGAILAITPGIALAFVAITTAVYGLIKAVQILGKSDTFNAMLRTRGRLVEPEAGLGDRFANKGLFQSPLLKLRNQPEVIQSAKDMMRALLEAMRRSAAEAGTLLPPAFNKEPESDEARRKREAEAERRAEEIRGRVQRPGLDKQGPGASLAALRDFLNSPALQKQAKELKSGISAVSTFSGKLAGQIFGAVGDSLPKAMLAQQKKAVAVLERIEKKKAAGFLIGNK